MIAVVSGLGALKAVQGGESAFVPILFISLGLVLITLITLIWRYRDG